LYRHRHHRCVANHHRHHHLQLQGLMWIRSIESLNVHLHQQHYPPMTALRHSTIQICRHRHKSL
jgi:hypothetical protein